MWYTFKMIYHDYFVSKAMMIAFQYTTLQLQN